MQEDEVVVVSSDSEEEEETLWKRKSQNKQYRLLLEQIKPILYYRALPEYKLFSSFPYSRLQQFSNDLKKSLALVKVKSTQAFIWKNVICWLTSIKLCFENVSDCINDRNFNLILTDLMAQYVDYKCQLHSSITDEAEVSKVSNEIVVTLNLIFSGWIPGVLMTLLKIEVIDDYHSILYPVFRKYLSNKHLHESNELISYLRLILCFRKWKKLAHFKEDKELINEIAVGKSAKALNADVIDLSSDTDTDPVLPKTVPSINEDNRTFAKITGLIGFASKNTEYGTRILLINKTLELDDTIEQYFKRYNEYINQNTQKLVEWSKVDHQPTLIEDLTRSPSPDHLPRSSYGNRESTQIASKSKSNGNQGTKTVNQHLSNNCDMSSIRVNNMFNNNLSLNSHLIENLSPSCKNIPRNRNNDVVLSLSLDNVIDLDDTNDSDDNNENLNRNPMSAFEESITETLTKLKRHAISLGNLVSVNVERAKSPSTVAISTDGPSRSNAKLPVVQSPRVNVEAPISNPISIRSVVSNLNEKPARRRHGIVSSTTSFEGTGDDSDNSDEDDGFGVHSRFLSQRSYSKVVEEATSSTNEIPKPSTSPANIIKIAAPANKSKVEEDKYLSRNLDRNSPREEATTSLKVRPSTSTVNDLLTNISDFIGDDLQEKYGFESSKNKCGPDKSASQISETVSIYDNVPNKNTNSNMHAYPSQSETTKQSNIIDKAVSAANSKTSSEIRMNKIIKTYQDPKLDVQNNSTNTKAIIENVRIQENPPNIATDGNTTKVAFESITDKSRKQQIAINESMEFPHYKNSAEHEVVKKVLENVKIRKKPDNDRSKIESKFKFSSSIIENNTDFMEKNSAMQIKDIFDQAPMTSAEALAIEENMIDQIIEDESSIDEIESPPYEPISKINHADMLDIFFDKGNVTGKYIETNNCAQMTPKNLNSCANISNFDSDKNNLQSLEGANLIQTKETPFASVTQAANTILKSQEKKIEGVIAKQTHLPIKPTQHDEHMKLTTGEIINSDHDSQNRSNEKATAIESNFAHDNSKLIVARETTQKSAFASFSQADKAILLSQEMKDESVIDKPAQPSIKPMKINKNNLMKTVEQTELKIGKTINSDHDNQNRINEKTTAVDLNMKPHKKEETTIRTKERALDTMNVVQADTTILKGIETTISTKLNKKQGNKNYSTKPEEQIKLKIEDDINSDHDYHNLPNEKTTTKELYFENDKSKLPPLEEGTTIKTKETTPVNVSQADKIILKGQEREVEAVIDKQAHQSIKPTKLNKNDLIKPDEQTKLKIGETIKLDHDYRQRPNEKSTAKEICFENDEIKLPALEPETTIKTNETTPASVAQADKTISKTQEKKDEEDVIDNQTHQSFEPTVKPDEQTELKISETISSDHDYVTVKYSDNLNDESYEKTMKNILDDISRPCSSSALTSEIEISKIIETFNDDSISSKDSIKINAEAKFNEENEIDYFEKDECIEELTLIYDAILTTCESENQTDEEDKKISDSPENKNEGIFNPSFKERSNSDLSNLILQESTNQDEEKANSVPDQSTNSTNQDQEKARNVKDKPFESFSGKSLIEESDELFESQTYDSTEIGQAYSVSQRVHIDENEVGNIINCNVDLNIEVNEIENIAKELQEYIPDENEEQKNNAGFNSKDVLIAIDQNDKKNENTEPLTTCFSINQDIATGELSRTAKDFDEHQSSEIKIVADSPGNKVDTKLRIEQELNETIPAPEIIEEQNTQSISSPINVVASDSKPTSDYLLMSNDKNDVPIEDNAQKMQTLPTFLGSKEKIVKKQISDEKEIKEESSIQQIISNKNDAITETNSSHEITLTDEIENNDKCAERIPTTAEKIITLEVDVKKKPTIMKIQDLEEISADHSIDEQIPTDDCTTKNLIKDIPLESKDHTKETVFVADPPHLPLATEVIVDITNNHDAIPKTSEKNEKDETNSLLSSKDENNVPEEEKLQSLTSPLEVLDAEKTVVSNNQAESIHKEVVCPIPIDDGSKAQNETICPITKKVESTKKLVIRIGKLSSLENQLKEQTSDKNEKENKLSNQSTNPVKTKEDKIKEQVSDENILERIAGSSIPLSSTQILAEKKDNAGQYNQINIDAITENDILVAETVKETTSKLLIIDAEETDNLEKIPTQDSRSSSADEIFSNLSVLECIDQTHDNIDYSDKLVEKEKKEDDKQTVDKPPVINQKDKEKIENQAFDVRNKHEDESVCKQIDLNKDTSQLPTIEIDVAIEKHTSVNEAISEVPIPKNEIQFSPKDQNAFSNRENIVENTEVEEPLKMLTENKKIQGIEEIRSPLSQEVIEFEHIAKIVDKEKQVLLNTPPSSEVVDISRRNKKKRKLVVRIPKLSNLKLKFAKESTQKPSTSKKSSKKSKSGKKSTKNKMNKKSKLETTNESKLPQAERHNLEQLIADSVSIEQASEIPGTNSILPVSNEDVVKTKNNSKTFDEHLFSDEGIFGKHVKESSVDRNTDTRTTAVIEIVDSSNNQEKDEVALSKSSTEVSGKRKLKFPQENENDEENNEEISFVKEPKPKNYLKPKTGMSPQQSLFKKNKTAKQEPIENCSVKRSKMDTEIDKFLLKSVENTASCTSFAKNFKTIDQKSTSIEESNSKIIQSGINNCKDDLIQNQNREESVQVVHTKLENTIELNLSSQLKKELKRTENDFTEEESNLSTKAQVSDVEEPSLFSDSENSKQNSSFALESDKSIVFHPLSDSVDDQEVSLITSQRDNSDFNYYNYNDENGTPVLDEKNSMEDESPSNQSKIISLRKIKVPTADQLPSALISPQPQLLLSKHYSQSESEDVESQRAFVDSDKECNEGTDANLKQRISKDSINRDMKISNSDSSTLLENTTDIQKNYRKQKKPQRVSNFKADSIDQKYFNSEDFEAAEILTSLKDRQKKNSRSRKGRQTPRITRSQEMELAESFLQHDCEDTVPPITCSENLCETYQLDKISTTEHSSNPAIIQEQSEFIQSNASSDSDDIGKLVIDFDAGKTKAKAEEKTISNNNKKDEPKKRKAVKRITFNPIVEHINISPVYEYKRCRTRPTESEDCTSKSKFNRGNAKQKKKEEIRNEKKVNIRQSKKLIEIEEEDDKQSEELFSKNEAPFDYVEKKSLESLKSSYYEISKSSITPHNMDKETWFKNLTLTKTVKSLDTGVKEHTANSSVGKNRCSENSLLHGNKSNADPKIKKKESTKLSGINKSVFNPKKCKHNTREKISPVPKIKESIISQREMKSIKTQERLKSGKLKRRKEEPAISEDHSVSVSTFQVVETSELKQNKIRSQNSGSDIFTSVLEGDIQTIKEEPETEHENTDESGQTSPLFNTREENVEFSSGKLSIKDKQKKPQSLRTDKQVKEGKTKSRKKHSTTSEDQSVPVLTSEKVEKRDLKQNIFPSKNSKSDPFTSVLETETQNIKEEPETDHENTDETGRRAENVEFSSGKFSTKDKQKKPEILRTEKQVKGGKNKSCRKQPTILGDQVVSVSTFESARKSDLKQNIFPSKNSKSETSVLETEIQNIKEEPETEHENTDEIVQTSPLFNTRAENVEFSSGKLSTKDKQKKPQTLRTEKQIKGGKIKSRKEHTFDNVRAIESEQNNPISTNEESESENKSVKKEQERPLIGDVKKIVKSLDTSTTKEDVKVKSPKVSTNDNKKKVKKSRNRSRDRHSKVKKGRKETQISEQLVTSSIFETVRVNEEELKDDSIKNDESETFNSIADPKNVIVKEEPGTVHGEDVKNTEKQVKSGKIIETKAKSPTTSTDQSELKRTNSSSANDESDVSKSFIGAENKIVKESKTTQNKNAKNVDEPAHKSNIKLEDGEVSSSKVSTDDVSMKPENLRTQKQHKSAKIKRKDVEPTTAEDQLVVSSTFENVRFDEMKRNDDSSKNESDISKLITDAENETVKEKPEKDNNVKNIKRTADNTKLEDGGVTSLKISTENDPVKLETLRSQKQLKSCKIKKKKTESTSKEDQPVVTSTIENVRVNELKQNDDSTREDESYVSNSIVGAENKTVKENPEQDIKAKRTNTSNSKVEDGEIPISKVSTEDIKKKEVQSTSTDNKSVVASTFEDVQVNELKRNDSTKIDEYDVSNSIAGAENKTLVEKPKQDINVKNGGDPSSKVLTEDGAMNLETPRTDNELKSAKIERNKIESESTEDASAFASKIEIVRDCELKQTDGSTKEDESDASNLIVGPENKDVREKSSQHVNVKNIEGTVETSNTKLEDGRVPSSNVSNEDGSMKPETLRTENLFKSDKIKRKTVDSTSTEDESAIASNIEIVRDFELKRTDDSTKEDESYASDSIVRAENKTVREKLPQADTSKTLLKVLDDTSQHQNVKSIEETPDTSNIKIEDDRVPSCKATIDEVPTKLETLRTEKQLKVVNVKKRKEQSTTSKDRFIDEPTIKKARVNELKSKNCSSKNDESDDLVAIAETKNKAIIEEIERTKDTSVSKLDDGVSSSKVSTEDSPMKHCTLQTQKQLKVAEIKETSENELKRNDNSIKIKKSDLILKPENEALKKPNTVHEEKIKSSVQTKDASNVAGKVPFVNKSEKQVISAAMKLHRAVEIVNLEQSIGQRNDFKQLCTSSTKDKKEENISIQNVDKKESTKKNDNQKESENEITSTIASTIKQVDTAIESKGLNLNEDFMSTQTNEISDVSTGIIADTFIGNQSKIAVESSTEELNLKVSNAGLKENVSIGCKILENDNILEEKCSKRCDSNQNNGSTIETDANNSNDNDQVPKPIAPIEKDDEVTRVVEIAVLKILEARLTNESSSDAVNSSSEGKENQESDTKVKNDNEQINKKSSKTFSKPKHSEDGGESLVCNSTSDVPNAYYSDSSEVDCSEKDQENKSGREKKKSEELSFTNCFELDREYLLDDMNFPLDQSSQVQNTTKVETHPSMQLLDCMLSGNSGQDCDEDNIPIFNAELGLEPETYSPTNIQSEDNLFPILDLYQFMLTSNLINGPENIPGGNCETADKPKLVPKTLETPTNFEKTIFEEEKTQPNEEKTSEGDEPKNVISTDVALANSPLVISSPKTKLIKAQMLAKTPQKKVSNEEIIESYTKSKLKSCQKPYWKRQKPNKSSVISLTENRYPVDDVKAHTIYFDEIFEEKKTEKSKADLSKNKTDEVFERLKNESENTSKNTSCPAQLDELKTSIPASTTKALSQQIDDSTKLPQQSKNVVNPVNTPPKQNKIKTYKKAEATEKVVPETKNLKKPCLSHENVENKTSSEIIELNNPYSKKPSRQSRLPSEKNTPERPITEDKIIEKKLSSKNITVKPCQSVGVIQHEQNYQPRTLSEQPLVKKTQDTLEKIKASPETRILTPSRQSLKRHSPPSDVKEVQEPQIKKPCSEDSSPSPLVTVVSPMHSTSTLPVTAKNFIAHEQKVFTKPIKSTEIQKAPENQIVEASFKRYPSEKIEGRPAKIFCPVVLITSGSAPQRISIQKLNLSKEQSTNLSTSIPNASKPSTLPSNLTNIKPLIIKTISPAIPCTKISLPNQNSKESLLQSSADQTSQTPKVSKVVLPKTSLSSAPSRTDFEKPKTTPSHHIPKFNSPQSSCTTEYKKVCVELENVERELRKLPKVELVYGRYKHHKALEAKRNELYELKQKLEKNGFVSKSYSERKPVDRDHIQHRPNYQQSYDSNLRAHSERQFSKASTSGQSSHFEQRKARPKGYVNKFGELDKLVANRNIHPIDTSPEAKKLPPWDAKPQTTDEIIRSLSHK